MLRLFIIALTLRGASASCWEPRMEANALLRDVPPHPRLRVNDERLAEIQLAIENDNTARQYFEGLLDEGKGMLSEPVLNCSTGADLGGTRAVLRRMYSLGLLWRLTKDDRFAQRGVEELLHVTTKCSTWDPFGLVMAEMTHAVGIGYDWMYNFITDDQRSSIVEGVTRLGFQEALGKYAQGIYWQNCTFNWGMVTNGGLSVGAVSFIEDAPEVASDVLSHALSGIPCVFASFGPDGGWHEGPMYWQYTSEYAQAVIQALRGTYGHDFGLSGAPGFNETGLFRLHMNGPSQMPFDYADSKNADKDIRLAADLMGYSAIPTTDDTVSSLMAYEARQLSKLISKNSSQIDCSPSGTGNDCARLLVDYSSAGSHQLLEGLPTAKVFRLSAFNWDDRAAVGFFRSAWSSEESGASGTETWLGFKAANGVPNHNDLDGGTFVFEAGGERWASDMGSDNYDLAGYWDQYARPNKRYSWYRKSTAGHNTLTFNSNDEEFCSSDQDPEKSGITEISLFEHGAQASPAYAIVNLSAAYAKQGALRVERGFAFTPGFEDLLVVDEINFPSADNVTWSMHTLADIMTDGDSAVLSLGGTELHATVVEPRGAMFSSAQIHLQKPQNPSDGFSKLMVQLPGTVNPTRIVVSLSLNSAATMPSLNSLAQWAAEGPFAQDVPIFL